MTTKERHQTGQVIERSGTFYIRYYRSEHSGGKVVRRRVSERLCEKDHVHRSTSCKAVRDLRDRFMVEVNKNSARVNPRAVPVTEFWDDVYLPWAKENLRPSSVFGYEKIWTQTLKPHFEGRTFSDYQTHEGSLLLTGLAKRLSRNSVAHVRSLASAIFSHAVNLGLLSRNPWREVKVLAKLRDAGPTKAYSLEEAENIISALAARVDAQTVVALAFFLGLRPSEIAGLRWGDIDEDWLHIRRAAVRGWVGATKTPESVASVRLIQPAKGLLAMWREKSHGRPAQQTPIDPGRTQETSGDDWVFPSRKGPLNVESFMFHVVKPLLKAAKVEWQGLYAARRGAGTILTALTGNALAAQQVLRHKSVLTTAGHYIKASAAAGEAGLKLLEQAAGTKSDTKQK